MSMFRNELYNALFRHIVVKEMLFKIAVLFEMLFRIAVYFFFIQNWHFGKALNSFVDFDG